MVFGRKKNSDGDDAAKARPKREKMSRAESKTHDEKRAQARKDRRNASAGRAAAAAQARKATAAYAETPDVEDLSEVLKAAEGITVKDISVVGIKGQSKAGEAKALVTVGANTFMVLGITDEGELIALIEAEDAVPARYFGAKMVANIEAIIEKKLATKDAPKATVAETVPEATAAAKAPEAEDAAPAEPAEVEEAPEGLARAETQVVPIQVLIAESGGEPIDLGYVFTEAAEDGEPGQLLITAKDQMEVQSIEILGEPNDMKTLIQINGHFFVAAKNVTGVKNKIEWDEKFDATEVSAEKAATFEVALG